jgi:hypothetical protein
MSDESTALPQARDTAALFAKGLARIEVEVPEWGYTIYVTELPGNEAGVFTDTMQTGMGFKPEAVMDYLAIVMVWEDGTRVIKSKEDRAAMAGQSFTVLQRIFLEALRVSQPTAAAILDEKKTSSKTDSPSLNGDSPST